MKRVSIFLAMAVAICVVATVTATTSEATSIVINVTQSPKAAPADGVVINGVVWAKYNVDAPGTFVATPEAAGKFYQWNRKVAWAATGDVTNWDDTDAAGDSWTEANDPSPEGWRVPTRAELNSLLDATKVSSGWTTQNGVKGQLFTDKATKATLFLPAAGIRLNSGGTLVNAGTSGDYWSSTATTYAYYLGFGRGNANVYNSGRGRGYSVRSVLK